MMCGVSGCWEHPRSSLVWRIPLVQRWLRTRTARLASCDWCQYGTPWRRPTKLLIWGPRADELAMRTCGPQIGRCSRSHHVRLSGVSGHRFLSRHAHSSPMALVPRTSQPLECATLGCGIRGVGCGGPGAERCSVRAPRRKRRLRLARRASHRFSRLARQVARDESREWRDVSHLARPEGNMGINGVVRYLRKYGSLPSVDR